MYLLDFVGIFHPVNRPLQRVPFAVRHGRFGRGHALAILGVTGALLWAGSGCIPATTEPNNPKNAPLGAPLISVDPAQDTTVDSIGTLDIVVAVHDPSIIDSVVVLFQGASQAYPAQHPSDTLFQTIVAVALAPLKHRTFSFSVNASNLLGKDTTTSSVNVRVR